MQFASNPWKRAEELATLRFDLPEGANEQFLSRLLGMFSLVASTIPIKATECLETLDF